MKNSNLEVANNINTELLLVNKNNGLSKDYTPKGLDIPNIEFTNESDREERNVAGVVIEPLEKLVQSAKDDGIILLGNSAYRSYKLQRKTYNDIVKAQGAQEADSYVAKPGFSEHQTGLCIDITNEDRYFVKGTTEADWLAENSYRFGFIIRFLEVCIKVREKYTIPILMLSAKVEYIDKIHMDYDWCR